jgi:alkanesulfonate monooxygenase SsuD/methylene tetrahydromethanopterin reductase-like flavin-dependent oxidoreductase (luciferase family)
MHLRVGTLASSEMLTGPHAGRRRLYERAAAAGIDHVFVADHVSFHTGLGMDGLLQAATAAAHSETLGVYVGVYLLALRHPTPVARQIASFAESAPGRLVFGVGVGGEDRHEIEICGVDPATRGRRTDEALTVLRGLLSGQPTSFRGDFFEIENACVLPAPEPAVPIVIGGRSRAALARAARHGDGWIAAWCSPRRFAEAVGEIAGLASDAGRGEIDWRHGLQVWVGIDDDASRARERLAHRMQDMYRIPFEPFEKYSPCGTPAQIAERLTPYVQAGCRDFNVMGVAESAERTIDGIAEIRERMLARPLTARV